MTIYGSSRLGVFSKIGVNKNFAKSAGKYLCQNVFFNKVADACKIIEKETLAQTFSCQFCEILKNTFLKRTLLVAASESKLPFLTKLSITQVI